jgi:pimeloyl-ACP methyl ester carboxylesterase
MTPVKYSEYLHRAIRHSKLCVVESAGHMLPIEKPEEYNKAVTQFLSSLPDGN